LGEKKKQPIAELHFKIVGMTRFELAASSSRTKRATGLRYIPLHSPRLFSMMNNWLPKVKLSFLLENSQDIIFW
jgi:hypothetical protein